MEQNKIRVQAQVYNNSLCIKCSSRHKVYWKEKKITGDEKKQPMQSMMLYSVLNVIKPLFFDLPVDHIEVQLSEECGQRFSGFFNFILNCLQITNEAIRRFKDKKGFAGNNETLLLYNIGNDSNFNILVEQLKRKASGKIQTLNFDPGFNPVERRWEKTDPPMTVDEFVSLISDNNIGKIVSINHYLLEKYLEKGVYLIALIKFFGLEHIIVDLDNYDLSPQGYQTKVFYNCSSFDRFSYTYFHKYWDQYYKLDNVKRLAYLKNSEEKFKFQEISDDYGVLITSNSRIRDVISFLNPMLFLLDHFPGETFITEFELWYYSLRYMILNIMDFNEFEKLHYNAFLQRFVYTITQLMKYDVIDSIQSERKIDLFGDSGWQHIFPEHYKRFLERKEIDQIVSEKRSLLLLFNWQTSWLESSAIIYEAMNYRIPFINHPPLVKTKILSALGNLEYQNPDELNQRIENIKPFLSSHVEAALNELNSLFKNNLDGMTDRILNRTTSDTSQDRFCDQLQKHDELLDQKVIAFIDTNEAMLRKTFKNLFLESIQYDISQSPYFEKEYFQRLLRFARQQAQS
jgi:hypothetical protein